MKLFNDIFLLHFILIVIFVFFYLVHGIW